MDSPGEEGEAYLQVDPSGRLFWASSGGAACPEEEAPEELAAWLENIFLRQRQCLYEKPPPNSARIFVHVDPDPRKPAWHALLDPEKRQPSLLARVPRWARTELSPIEASLLVHSHGLFDPRREGRSGAAALPPIVDEEGNLELSKIMVSVICPTTSERQAYHPVVYECFRRQSHKNRELVVVDTGAEPSRFFQERAAEDDRVVYRHYPVAAKEWSLGLKRNMACFLARGQAIAHFDDDDLYAPAYLSFMLQRLAPKKSRERWAGAKVPRVVAKLSAWHILDADTLTWGFLDAKTDPDVEEMRHSWLYGWGFSYIFTRTVWEREPFPEVSFAEDYFWISKVLESKVPVNLARDQKMQTEGVACHTYHPLTSTSGGEFSQDWRCGFLVPKAPPSLVDLVPMFEEALAMLPRKQPSSKYEAMLRQDFADRIGLQEKARKGGRLLKYRMEQHSSCIRW